MTHNIRAVEETCLRGFKMTLDIRPISEVSVDEAVDLMMIGMGGRYSRDERIKLWEWKHIHNPMGRSLGTAAFDRNTGVLVGLRPFMRWSLIGPSGKLISAVRAVDSVVHPAFRRRGIFSILTMAALEEARQHKIDLVFNTPNFQSAPGYEKLGWHLLGHPHLMIRLRRPYHLLTRALNSRDSARSDELDLPMNWRTWPRSNSLHLFSSNGNTRPSYRVFKDEEFLKWRYASHPVFDYRVFEVPVKDGENDSVVVIVRKDKRKGLQGIAVLEVFTEGISRLLLRQLSRKVFSESSSEYIVIMSPNLGQVDLVNRFQGGFVTVPWKNVRLATRFVNDSEYTESLTDITMWDLSLGDLEIF